MTELQMTFTLLDEQKSLALIHVAGDMDYPGVQEFQAALDAHLAKGINRLILDLEKVTYINTSLGVLVKNADLFRKAGGGLALLNVPAKVKIVLEMLKLDRFFAICKDLDSARQALLATPCEEQSTSSQAPNTPDN